MYSHLRNRAALVYFAIGLSLFAAPYPFYFWSLATGRLVAEQEWFARGMSHGPWRREWESALVLLPTYILLLGALVLTVSAVALAFKWREPRRLLAMGGVALCYVAFLVILSHTVYWTVS